MILFSSVKTLSENFSESRIKSSVLASFPAIGRFSPLFTPHWMLEKSAKMYRRLRNNFHDHGQLSEQFRVIGEYLKARKSSLKKVSVRIFGIIVFIEADKKFKFNCLHNKASQNLKKPSALIQKVRGLISISIL
jgi:hypothetical protein